MTRQPAAEEKEGAAGEGQHHAHEQIGDDPGERPAGAGIGADRPAGRFTGDQGGDDDGEDPRQGNEAGGDLAPGGLRDEEGVEKVPAEQRRPEGEGDKAAARQALVADDRQVGDEMLKGCVVAGYDEEGGSAHDEPHAPAPGRGLSPARQHHEEGDQGDDAWIGVDLGEGEVPAEGP